MAQVSTKKVTFSSIVGSAAFKRGMDDYQQGKPFDPEFDRWGKATWHYERGRLYAAACLGKGEKLLPNRLGRAVNRGVIQHFMGFYYRKEVI